MILKLSCWKQNLLFRRGKVQKKSLVVEKKYVWSFLLYVWVKATDHEILWLQPGKCWSWSYGTFFYFPMGQCKMQTADWLWTIVFRVRKQWDYCCHVLICMVKTIVCSLRHFTITNPIQSGSGKYITYMSPIHTAIPCHPSCSGQGMCLKDGQCLCWWGWTGPNAKYIVSGSLKNRILVRAEWPP